MKIFALSDTHGLDDFHHLLAAARSADLVLVAGDISVFGMGTVESLEGLRIFQRELSVPVVVVHGNHEWDGLKQYSKDFPELIFLDKESLEVAELRILGFGGGGFARHDEEFERFIKQHYPHQSEHRDVWLMHGPPFDMEIDVLRSWGPTGCKSRRAMVLKHKPFLVIAGHIHENAGVITQHENVLLCNPGPNGVLIDLSQPGI